MLKIILIVIVVVVVLFVIVVALQPAAFRITRKTTINAPADAVFAQVNNFHKWRAWSPWEKRDPELKRTYAGPESGAGAVYSWVGNKEVGEGRMTLTDSQPASLIRIKLEFFKPFAATNIAEFTFEPQGNNETVVSWSMAGRNGFMAKAFCMFMDMDKMIGGDFEKGLAAMKSVAESSAAPAHLASR